MMLVKTVYFQEQKFYSVCVSEMVLWAASETFRDLFVVELMILLTSITLMVAEILEHL